MHVLVLYGASVNYYGNCLRAEHTSGSIVHVSQQPIFKRKLLWTHDACTINPYFHLDLCERDNRTILPATVGLLLAWQMYIENLWMLCVTLLEGFLGSRGKIVPLWDYFAPLS